MFQFFNFRVSWQQLELELVRLGYVNSVNVLAVGIGSELFLVNYFWDCACQPNV